MALTREDLIANEVLANLSDDAITAIETLSTNNENDVIGQRIGELHGRYDADVLEVAGIPKLEGEKTYDYVKRTLSTFKESAAAAETYKADLEASTTKIADLEAAIAKGSTDPMLKQQLQDAKDELATTKQQYLADKDAWKAEKDTLAGEATKIQVDAAFKQASAPLKFKTAYSDSIQKTLLNAAKAEILASAKPDIIEVDGERTMVLRDAKGEIMRNRNNKLEPYTVEELLAEKLGEALDVTAGSGGGTKKPGGKDNNSLAMVDLGSAKTQVEADSAIVRHLLEKGFLRGTAEFAEEQTKIRTENKVMDLPIR